MTGDPFSSRGGGGVGLAGFGLLSLILLHLKVYLTY